MPKNIFQLRIKNYESTAPPSPLQKRGSLPPYGGGLGWGFLTGRCPVLMITPLRGLHGRSSAFRRALPDAGGSKAFSLN